MRRLHSSAASSLSPGLSLSRERLPCTPLGSVQAARVDLPHHHWLPVIRLVSCLKLPSQSDNPLQRLLPLDDLVFGPPCPSLPSAIASGHHAHSRTVSLSAGRRPGQCRS